MKILQNPPRRPQLDVARDDAAYARAHQEIAEANQAIIAAAWDAARVTASKVAASADAPPICPDCGAQLRHVKPKSRGLSRRPWAREAYLAGTYVCPVGAAENIEWCKGRAPMPADPNHGRHWTPAEAEALRATTASASDCPECASSHDEGDGCWS